ncbi:glycosyltransferase family 2 protein [Candidatus Woesebacteria bacterium]|nr:glycosyltransferase family 2 protein [Candidatus Woesebacteria bacterium]
MKKLLLHSVSIVLPNWNGVELLKKNLPSVIDACSNCEIIVADDASADDSVSFLHEKFPQVRVVSNQSRQGFAGNVNSGVARASGDIVVLLNTDVRPNKDFLKAILPHFDNQNIFAVGCLEKSYELSGVVNRGRGIARWEKGYFIHAKGDIDASDTAWVSGGSAAYRRTMWEKLGGMDTMFNPFYWEDIDLSYRAKKAGWEIVFEPKSVIEHYHDQGTIKTSYSKNDVKRIVYRNQYLFIWKNISDISLILSHIAWTPIRLIQGVFSGDMLMIQGYAWALMKLPLVWNSRNIGSRLWKKNDNELFATI